MQKTLSLLLSVLAMVMSFTACGSNAPKELQQGVQVINAMTSVGYLSGSAFYAAYPDGKPSDYVRYTFSDIGAAEWPVAAGGMGYDEMEAEQSRSIGMPIIPAGIHYSPNTPNPSIQGMQVVLRGDDAKGVLVIEGYVNPAEKPVIVKEKKLPKVKPSDIAVMTYQSAIEMGASDGSQ